MAAHAAGLGKLYRVGRLLVALALMADGAGGLAELWKPYAPKTGVVVTYALLLDECAGSCALGRGGGPAIR